MHNVDMTDPLLAYCIALDANDFDREAAIYQQAETEPGLLEAISAIHTRFGFDETWTKQLLRERQRYQTEKGAIM